MACWLFRLSSRRPLRCVLLNFEQHLGGSFEGVGMVYRVRWLPNLRLSVTCPTAPPVRDIIPAPINRLIARIASTAFVALLRIPLRSVTDSAAMILTARAAFTLESLEVPVNLIDVFLLEAIHVGLSMFPYRYTTIQMVGSVEHRACGLHALRTSESVPCA